MCSRQASTTTAQINLSSLSTSNYSHTTQAYITNYFQPMNQHHQRSAENPNVNPAEMNGNSTPAESNENLATPESNEISVLAETVSLSSLPTYYNNVRSITNKRNICMMIDLSVYKVLCFTETWLSDAHFSSVYFPAKFNVYRCDRVNTASRSGGVAVLVHRSLRSKQLILDVETELDCEYLAIEVSVKPTPLIYYVCYMSVFDHQIAMKHHRRVKLITENYLNHRIIVLGDFNLHDIIWTSDQDNLNVFLPHAATNVATNHRRSQYNEAALDFLNQMMELPLFQLSNLRNTSGNVLDLLFVSEPSFVNLSVDRSTIVDGAQQDEHHIPFEMSVDYTEEKSDMAKYLTVFRYANGNYERICQQLEAVNFQHEFNTRDTDTAYEFFMRTLNTLIEQNVPKSTFKLYTNKPKWWSTELQRLKNRRDKLYKRKPKGVMTEGYATALQEFNELNERRHNDYILKLQENMKQNPKEFWEFAKINCKSTTYPNTMHYNEQKSNSQSELVNLFANYFETIYVRDEEPWNFEDIYHPMPDSVDINISLFDVESAIQTIKWTNGAGPDELSPYVIKKCASVIVWPIWLLFQKSFETGKIPDALKVSRVVPVHKKGDKANAKNYRVIAIASIIMKIYEIAIKKRLTLIVNPKLTNAQHGFRPSRSVMTNLLNLSILAHNAFEKSRQLDVFYGDFKTAFNTVWLKRLIEKIAAFGIGAKTAKWLCEFVTSRTNFVKIGNSKSRIYNSPSGVPAGSTLGPLLFSMFINDIVETVQHATVLLFADDIKIAQEIRTVNGLNNTFMLQRDINNLMRWCDQNRLYFNRSKCAIFSAYRDNTRFIEATYKMDEHEIERQQEIRDLGVLLDRRLSFGHHIEQITVKCRQLIGCIKRYSNGNFTKDTQRVLYIAYVRSRLEFASVIWNPYVNIYVDDIESIQKQFVIYLLESRRNASSFRLSPYEDRCKLVGLQSLEIRRKVADAVLAFDIYSRNINDDLINSKFIRTEYNYSLRSNTMSLLVQPSLFVEYLINQPIIRMIRLINDYKNIVITYNSRNGFKTKMFDELLDSMYSNEM